MNPDYEPSHSSTSYLAHIIPSISKHGGSRQNKNKNKNRKSTSTSTSHPITPPSTNNKTNNNISSKYELNLSTDSNNNNNNNNNINSEKSSSNKHYHSMPVYAFELTVNEEEWWSENKIIKDVNDFTTHVTLLILDPQNDFHYGQGVEGDKDYREDGSLAVPGM